MPDLSQSYTALEIMAMVFPAPVWFVLEMITVGLTLLVGPPKGGKS